MKKMIISLFAIVLLAGCSSVKEFDPGNATQEQFLADKTKCEEYVDKKLKHATGGYQIRNVENGHNRWIHEYNICMKSKGYDAK